MSYEDDIRKAWKFLRENEHSVPSHILDLMRDSALERINPSPMPLDRLMGALVAACWVKANHEFIKPFLETCLQNINSGKGIDGKEPSRG